MIETELKARLALEGIHDLDYHVLADRSGIRIENDEVVGVDEAVKKLKEAKPHIFGRPSTSHGGPAPTPAPTGDPGPVKDVRKMDNKDYREYKEGFLAKLRRGEIPKPRTV